MPTGTPGRTHGLASTYNGDRRTPGCRCELCKQAMREFYGYRLSRAEHMAQFYPLKHGVTRYKKGCRCEVCKEASARSRKRRRQAPNPAVHGSNAYRNGCRCDICRACYREWWRERRESRRES